MAEASCERVILIVEDDRDVRESIVEVLQDSSYHVLDASNGKEALERLRGGERPCLILLDAMMPVMNGWEFRAEQQQDQELSAIPVVVLSAHASAEETARTMGVAGYLKKPVRLERLLATVKRYCEGA